MADAAAEMEAAAVKAAATATDADAGLGRGTAATATGGMAGGGCAHACVDGKHAADSMEVAEEVDSNV